MLERRLRPAGLTQAKKHDLKHTFGRRLRAAGVSFKGRQALLGHKSGRITTHYSGPSIFYLIAAANQILGKNARKNPALVRFKQEANTA